MKPKRKCYSEKLLQFPGDAKKLLTQPYRAKMPSIKLLSLRKSEMQTFNNFFIDIIIDIVMLLMIFQRLQDLSKAMFKKLIKQ